MNKQLIVIVAGIALVGLLLAAYTVNAANDGDEYCDNPDCEDQDCDGDCGGNCEGEYGECGGGQCYRRGTWSMFFGGCRR